VGRELAERRRLELAFKGGVETRRRGAALQQVVANITRDTCNQCHNRDHVNVSTVSYTDQQFLIQTT
jgi:hypothetical protein